MQQLSMTECGFCKEPMRSDATVCPHCRKTNYANAQTAQGIRRFMIVLPLVILGCIAAGAVFFLIA